MSKPSRRTLVTSAAALPLVGLPVGVIADGNDEALRRLWSEYRAKTAAEDAAHKKMKPVRAAFDAEYPPCPDEVRPGDHWHAHEWLWKQHGLDVLSAAWNDADAEVRETIATIQSTKAKGLFGVGVKLAALPI